jgi:hypothetical protein
MVIPIPIKRKPITVADIIMIILLSYCCCCVYVCVIFFYSSKNWTLTFDVDSRTMYSCETASPFIIDDQTEDATHVRLAH